MPCCRREIEEGALWELREWLRTQKADLEPVMTGLKHDFFLNGKYARLIKPDVPATAPVPPESLPSPGNTGKDSEASDLPNPPQTTPINGDPDSDSEVVADERPIEVDFLKQNGPVPGSIMANHLKALHIAQLSEEENKEAREAEKKPPYDNTQFSMGGKSAPLARDKGSDVPTDEEPKVIEKPTICRTCEQRYTAEDKLYQCSKACQCQHCIIQALVGPGDKANCDICGDSYRAEAKNLAIRGYRQCHVCGIAIDINEIEFLAPCKLCRNCVTVTESSSFLGLFSSTKGTCRLCNPEHTFDIDGTFYRDQKTLTRVSACCGKRTEREHKLTCGHFVCGTHREALKHCRICHETANSLTSIY